MKQVLFSLLMILTTTKMIGQTASSTANGSWLNPFNWSCNCVPLPGYTVIINHAIVLNTDFAYTSGSITINAGGSLIEDATPRNMAIGANFLNKGQVKFHALLISGGTTTNDPNAQFTLSAFTNSASLYNYGRIDIDSFHNTSSINNEQGTIAVSSFLNSGLLTNNAKIIVDSFYNDGTITNNDTIDVSSFYNRNIINNYKDIYQQSNTFGKVDSIFNSSIFNNHLTGIVQVDSITNGKLGVFNNKNVLSFSDFSNLGNCYNEAEMLGSQSFWNSGFFDNKLDATMAIGVSFYNGDTAIAMKTAHYKNNGLVTVGDSWYNADTISGTNTGSFTVQNTSRSSGYMMGSFDFCDATPPPTSPFIDLHIGYIDPNITYCSLLGTSSLAYEKKSLQIYPNPVTTELTIIKHQEAVLQVQVLNTLGQLVLQQKLTSSHEKISLINLDTGVYWLLIRDESGKAIQVEKLVKQ